MPSYTLTYSPPAEGWPSFYSYYPEWIQGMNQYLYTFSGGNLWRHNTNEERNTFYGTYDPNVDSSQIQSVFNDEPIVNKIFKTLAVEGNAAWSATMISDQQDGRFIDAELFEKKEGDYFAFVRTENNTPAQPDEYALRSLNGIGVGTVTVPGQVDFPLTQPLGSILNEGDYFYYAAPPSYDTLVYAGVVQSITVDIPGGINRVVHDNAGAPDPLLVAPFCVGIKDQQAESNGLLGHYGVFTLTNTDTTSVEMFVAKSEVMKSYPG